MHLGALVSTIPPMYAKVCFRIDAWTSKASKFVTYVETPLVFSSGDVRLRSWSKCSFTTPFDNTSLWPDFMAVPLNTFEQAIRCCTCRPTCEDEKEQFHELHVKRIHSIEIAVCAFCAQNTPQNFCRFVLPNVFLTKICCAASYIGRTITFEKPRIPRFIRRMNGGVTFADTNVQVPG